MGDGCCGDNGMALPVGCRACVDGVDDGAYGVFPYGYSGVGCCVYTDYGAFYGGYGWFVGLWLG